MAKHVWTQGDDIITLYVYRFGASSLGQTTEQLAAAIGTTPASFRMRIGNFKALDGHGGLANAAELSRQVYQRHHQTEQATLRSLALRELGTRCGGAEGYAARIDASGSLTPTSLQQQEGAVEGTDASTKDTKSTKGGISLPAVILIVLLTAGGALFAGRTLLAPAVVVVAPTDTPLFGGPTATPAIRAQAVTQQIQALSKLVTTSYHMQVVVERSEEYPSAGGARDTVLLIAGGTVVAGVDLAKIKESDIQVLDNGTRVRVKLPPIEIFPFTGLDEAKTRVYRHDTPEFFNPIDDLETRARQDAKDEIIRVACKDGIMDTTTKATQQAVEQFLKSVGVANPEVVSSAPPSCPVSTEPTPTPKP